MTGAVWPVTRRLSDRETGYHSPEKGGGGALSKEGFEGLEGPCHGPEDSSKACFGASRAASSR